MEEQKKAGWETWARMEKILAMVLHEVYNQEVEEAVDALAKGFESFYGKALKAPGDEDAKID